MSAFRWGLINGTIAGDCRFTRCRGPCLLFATSFFPRLCLHCSFPIFVSPSFLSLAQIDFLRTRASQCTYPFFSLSCCSCCLSFAIRSSPRVRPLSTLFNYSLLLSSDSPGFAWSTTYADVYKIGCFIFFSLPLMRAHWSLVCRACAQSPCHSICLASFSIPFGSVQCTGSIPL